MMRTKLNLSVSALVLALLSASSVFAQSSGNATTAKPATTANKQTPAPTKSPTTEQQKGAVTNAAEAPSKSPTVASETKGAKSEKSADPSATSAPKTAAEKVPDTEKDIVIDPIANLREQIAAASPDEKLDLQFELVNLLTTRGLNQDAINELRAMTGEDVFDPQAFYNIGNALARIGDAEGATNAYQKAIAQKKGRYSKAFNNLGVIQMRRGRWEEAYQAFLSALRLENFHYAEASYNLGRLYAARGENDLAVREWRRALAVNPEHMAAAQALATIGSAERIAVSPLPKNPSAQKNSSPRSKPVRKPETEPLVLKSARVPRPLSGIQRLTVDPDTYVFLQRARDAREADHQEEAVANYRRVISRMGGYFAPANLEMSYALLNLKRPDDAMTNLLAVAKNDGGHYPIVYYHLARLYEARGDLKMAEESFGMAARFSKENAQFLLDVSRVRERLGDLQGALTALEEYLAVMESQHLKPDWSNERLASLRQRLTATPSKP